MARVKVKLADNLPRVVFIESEATRGATLGSNVYTPDGKVATPASFATWLNLTASGGRTTGNHSELAGLQFDDHKQYVLRDILTANGDLFTRAGGVITRLDLGAPGTFLRSVSGAPDWAALLWGDIGGTLSDQADLQLALDAKADKATTITAGTGLAGGGDLSANRTIDLDQYTLDSLGLADTSLQPDDIGVMVQGYDIVLDLLTDLTDPGSNKFVMWDDSAGTFVFADAGGGSGTVTSVATGTGLTGGPITSSGTISLDSASIASLSLADSSVQPGDDVSDLVNDAGYITSSSLPTGANPSATIGLSAVNGSATTFLRSDGAPALDQAISPTWTAQHIFTSQLNALNSGVRFSSALPGFWFEETDGGTNQQLWWMRAQAAVLEIQASNDTVNAFSRALSFERSAGSVTVVNLGNTTANTTIRIPDGSASSPAINFQADTNTGIYRSGTDTLAIAAGGVLKANFNSGSNVLRLFSNDADGDVYLSFYESNAESTRKGYVGYGGTNNDAFFIWNQKNAQIQLGTNNTARVVVSEGGQFRVVSSASASTPDIASNSDTNTGIYWIGADQLGFAEGGTGYRIGFRDIPRRTSGFARGECLAVSSGITLNTSDMAAGYSFTVYNDSGSDITITQGSGVTLRLVGTGTTGNRTLPARGLAFIWCNSGTEAVISGVT